MTTRSGSYPLMNLAADFGVDYGDVLVIAEEGRRVMRRDGDTRAWMELADDADRRIEAKVGWHRAHQLFQEIHVFNARRWA